MRKRLSAEQALGHSRDRASGSIRAKMEPMQPLAPVASTGLTRDSRHNRSRCPRREMR
jgi:hypothetical protein